MFLFFWILQTAELSFNHHNFKCNKPHINWSCKNRQKDSRHFPTSYFCGCVFFLPPKEGFLLKELWGGRSHCHFAIFLSRRRALESRARRRRERWRRWRSLYLGVAMDAEGAAGVAGKRVEVFSMSFNGMFWMKFSFGIKTWWKWLKLTHIFRGNADFLKMPSF